jgi:chromosome segregation ATPase
LETTGFHGGARYEKTSYTYRQAADIIRKYGDEYGMEIFESAVSWFDNTADTNPFRTALTELEADRDLATATINDLQKRIERLQGEALQLSRAQKEVQANEQSYLEVQASGLFTAAEMDAPEHAGTQVEGEYQQAVTALTAHREKRARFDSYLTDWRQYQSEYGEHDPTASIKT